MEMNDMKDAVAYYLSQPTEPGRGLVRALWQEVQRLRVDIENITAWKPVEYPPYHANIQVELFYESIGRIAIGYWDGKHFSIKDPTIPKSAIPTHYRHLPPPPSLG